jgi:ribosome-associated toxin RatA of RatAB toxin-antitoxin module
MIIASRSISAPPEAVWATVQNQTSFVSEVDDVHEVEILSTDLISDKTERVVRWCVWLKGFEIRWQEHQKLDSTARRLEFRQIEGIFNIYAGAWQVLTQGNGVIVELHIRVATGIPYLAEFIDPVIASAFETLAENILRGIERLSLNHDHTGALGN